MVKLWTAIGTIVVACTVAVQGASLFERACPSGDHGQLKCETSGGSPPVGDCEVAIRQLDDSENCSQENTAGSFCTTIKKSGHCKIDVCGKYNARIADTSTMSCKQYLNNLLHSCQSNNRIGGQIFPQPCNVDYGGQPPDDPELKDKKHFRVQFSYGK